MGEKTVLEWVGEQETESFARVLVEQRTELTGIDLSDNQIGDHGTETLAGVLTHFTSLTHINLNTNVIGPLGATSLAGVLTQCNALTHLDLNHT
jgi:Ran GTPase-activating protein (RanGAP) involved in mRNA processing and transport